MLGAGIYPPCINKSESQTVIYGKDIFIGFMHLSELETGIIEQLIDERHKNGEYKSLEDFLERVHITIEQISILIRINAFRFTGINKRELLLKSHLLLNKSKPEPKQCELFRTRPKKIKLPELSTSIYEDAFDQMEIMGFSLYSPFLLLQNEPGDQLLAKDLERFTGQNITIRGYLVTIKVTITSNNKRMHFGTFLDRKGYFFDTTHFPDVAARYPFRGRGVYKITGKVAEEFEFCSIEVIQMEKEPVIEDPRYSEKDLPSEKQMINALYQGMIPIPSAY
jgi:DNA polymerase III alpha subunit